MDDYLIISPGIMVLSLVLVVSAVSGASGRIWQQIAASIDAEKVW